MGYVTHVDVTGPVNLALNNVLNDTSLGGLDDSLVPAKTVTGSHGKVGEEGNGGDGSGDDVEQALLDRDAGGHDVEGDRGQTHEDTDDPESTETGLGGLLVVDMRNVGDDCGKVSRGVADVSLGGSLEDAGELDGEFV